VKLHDFTLPHYSGLLLNHMSWCSSVNVDTRLWYEWPGFNFQQQQWWNFFSLPLHADWLCSPPSLTCNGYQGSYSGSKVAGVWSWPFISI